MDGADGKRKPVFLRHGLLILLPVAVLAVVGLYSVRLDRALARHDATERAQALADVLAQKLWTSFTALKEPAQLDRHAFEVNAAGDLVFPRPVRQVPLAVGLDPAALDPEQSRLWLAARSAEAAGQPGGAVRQAYAEFLASRPTPNFAAAARYAQGLCALRESRPDLAAEAFQSVARDYPAAVGETGLPLRPLAQLKLLELAVQPPGPQAANPAALLDEVCSNAVNYPSLASALILSRASELAADGELRTKAETWLQLWQQQQFCRGLFTAANPYSLREPLFWFTLLPAVSATGQASAGTGASAVFMSTKPVPADKWSAIFKLDPRPAWFFEDSAWLAFSVRDSLSNHWFVCRTESELGYQLSSIVSGTRGIPDYFGVGIELGGRQLTSSAWDLRLWRMAHYIGGKGLGQDEKVFSGGLATEVLAFATPSGIATDPLKVNIYLTSPTTLYHRQETRNFWFGALIVASAIAAFVGWFSAWRAFHRQQELAALKSNFVSSVSHELRAPLASVRLMAESLERGKISEAPKQHEYFGYIVQECCRLSSLIENVLDFSRIEQGRKEYDFEPTDLVALARQTVRLMGPRAAEREVRLDLEIAGGEPAFTAVQIVADGKAVQQALVNLLDNAIKHSPRGETVMAGLEMKSAELGVSKAECIARNAPPVEVRSADAAARTPLPAEIHSPASNRRSPSESSPEPPPGPRILLWVEDHGEGIPPAEHEKIFERFYRRGSELRRETQGVGIGLSIVKHIVEAHGGCVRVRSEVGQGSRFTIELPLRPENGRAK